MFCNKSEKFSKYVFCFTLSKMGGIDKRSKWLKKRKSKEMFWEFKNKQVIFARSSKSHMQETLKVYSLGATNSAPGEQSKEKPCSMVSFWEWNGFTGSRKLKRWVEVACTFSEGCIHASTVIRRQYNFRPGKDRCHSANHPAGLKPCQSQRKCIRRE